MSVFTYRVWDGKKMLPCGVDSAGNPIKFNEDKFEWVPVDEHPSFEGDTALEAKDVMIAFGLTDKNNVKAYTGDIVLIDTETEHNEGDNSDLDDILEPYYTTTKFYAVIGYNEEDARFEFTGAFSRMWFTDENEDFDETKVPIEVSGKWSGDDLYYGDFAEVLKKHIIIGNVFANSDLIEELTEKELYE